ncbi:MAG TPA: basic amino acid ABC transporter substrate-binding protein [Spirochaetota bacterium]|nr:basic amino acid ABC transporter substrate-binding protein [Spirochaetota bacterium]HPJ34510.1 basic amino acid ABC transporter substrate-binding protein [Spirochaetota bacterium]
MISVASFCVFSGCSKEQASGKIISVATDATWPPMEYVDENKKIVGFDIDLLNAAAKEGGFTVEFKNTAWDGIFAGLGAGKYDAVCSSVTITDDRKKTMDFSVPYVSIGQTIVVKKETTGMEELSKFEGKKVGAQIGTTGAIEIAKNKNITLKTYDEIGLAIEDLAKGRIEAVVCDNPIAANYALLNPKYKALLKIVGEPFTTEEYGIAVKKGNKEVLDMVNAGLAKVKEKGIDKELEKKWLR